MCIHVHLCSDLSSFHVGLSSSDPSQSRLIISIRSTVQTVSVIQLILSPSITEYIQSSPSISQPQVFSNSPEVTSPCHHLAPSQAQVQVVIVSDLVFGVLSILLPTKQSTKRVLEVSLPTTELLNARRKALDLIAIGFREFAELICVHNPISFTLPPKLSYLSSV